MVAPRGSSAATGCPSYVCVGQVPGHSGTEVMALIVPLAGRSAGRSPDIEAVHAAVVQATTASGGPHDKGSRLSSHRPTLRDVLMAYDDGGAGDGMPVVLLHSGVCDRRMWDPQWDPLTQSFRVVRPDLRGFGETPLPPGRFSFAADVVELLDHLGVERACVVGSSLGGRVALELAATAPRMVERLVLLCPALAGFPTPDADAFEKAEEALYEVGDIDGFVELNVATWVGPEANDEVRDLVRAMQRRAAEVQIAAESEPEPPELHSIDVDPATIACPSVVVSGGADLDRFQAVAAHLTKAIPNARGVHLEWAGHLPSLERPDVVTALVADFCGTSVGRYLVRC